MLKLVLYSKFLLDDGVRRLYLKTGSLIMIPGTERATLEAVTIPVQVVLEKGYTAQVLRPILIFQSFHQHLNQCDPS